MAVRITTIGYSVRIFGRSGLLKRMEILSHVSVERIGVPVELPSFLAR